MTSAATHTAGTRLRRRVLADSASTRWCGLALEIRDVGNVIDCPDHQATARRRRRHRRRTQRHFKRRSGCPGPTYSVSSAAWYNGGKVQSALASADVWTRRLLRTLPSREDVPHPAYWLVANISPTWFVACTIIFCLSVGLCSHSYLWLNNMRSGYVTLI